MLVTGAPVGFQYDLDGEDDEQFSPPVDYVDMIRLQVIILEGRDDTSISDIDIKICCTPFSKLTGKNTC